ncbi:unnamed protein product [Didymodactylos carnosus]|uniref:Uncharacterized protein n=1 Tax=Didymodactylos carnosus TaxID=1234261 RepID=A0A814IQP6_9BILA|nr:unnamed protein product [Didymodactylos carnosus]CAF1029233.1 unnamed protein product [Didymodactylos carnosus]CAF3555435.1 unnamed protein product [Didymodactylos carnosus]CAF3800173.1 unnamed protein product [Didymodactylos carnosus]
MTLHHDRYFVTKLSQTYESEHLSLACQLENILSRHLNDKYKHICRIICSKYGKIYDPNKMRNVLSLINSNGNTIRFLHCENVDDLLEVYCTENSSILETQNSAHRTSIQLEPFTDICPICSQVSTQRPLAKSVIVFFTNGFLRKGTVYYYICNNKNAICTNQPVYIYPSHFGKSEK